MDVICVVLQALHVINLFLFSLSTRKPKIVINILAYYLILLNHVHVHAITDKN